MKTLRNDPKRVKEFEELAALDVDVEAPRVPTGYIRNSDMPADHPRRKGRRPGPKRSVIQLRCRMGGKVVNFWSVTLHQEPSKVMKILQEMFPREDWRKPKLQETTKGGAS